MRDSNDRVRRDSLEQDRVNRRVYHSSDIARSYQTPGLDCAETMALLKYQPAFVQRDVLDIGIGTGRTTRFLAPLARRYVGVDYSPHMIEHIRKSMPDVTVRQADMRDLSPFDATSFDFVMASCCVIDAVSHEDRLRVLAEVWRVLRPGGLFLFSSHNRTHSRLGQLRMRRSRNPVTQAVHAVQYFRSVFNHHTKTGHLRRIEDEYALLDDGGHNHALLHYYIDRRAQSAQLQRDGFRLLDVFSLSGHALRESEEDTESSGLLYVGERLS